MVSNDCITDTTRLVFGMQGSYSVLNLSRMESVTNEAQERRREEQKRQEEERKANIMAAFKLVAEQAAELAVDKERRIILQVSFRFHRFGTGS